jgi:hypothetical protein
MRKTLEGLRAKEITLLKVVHNASGLDGGDYRIEQINVGSRTLIAIPIEYILELMGENLLEGVIRCSKNSLKSLKRKRRSCRVVFDVKNKSIKAQNE